MHAQTYAGSMLARALQVEQNLAVMSAMLSDMLKDSHPAYLTLCLLPG